MKLEKIAEGRWLIRNPEGDRLPVEIMGGNGSFIAIARGKQLPTQRTRKNALLKALAHLEASK